MRRARFLEEKQTIDIGRKELSFGDVCRWKVKHWRSEREVIQPEACLAHAVGTATLHAYQRSSCWRGADC